ncbi:hypothetical protein NQ166_10470 [Microbacterium sp. zg.Y1090]|uniref:hypothetical protein n=1 Tax=Microbacterium TaxID=33882 RepID=UPI00214D055A|nr:MULTISPECIES: hypothetical protein [unclassified Microbacterium]MCR2813974.1 hypothetical protein [Microbacterium sp. zg.Y1084]MCR2819248.1 hypothetical protein [Microbacterium sp. zg.Y1090]MDL5487165.1 hypothetical protein [Microbacterium sp. zg-Y1211]WIM28230.1 hypothetical protein QNO26_13970 [Microbacterium sp. zg-Y1090]
MRSDASWLELLERFERDLDADAHDAAPWDPILKATPLPADLVARANRLVARQQERMAQLRTELAATRAHLDAIGMVPPLREDAAAYVDRDG